MTALDWLRLDARRRWVYDRWPLERVVEYVNRERPGTPFRGLWTPRTLKLLMGTP